MATVLIILSIFVLWLGAAFAVRFLFTTGGHWVWVLIGFTLFLIGLRHGLLMILEQDGTGWESAWISLFRLLTSCLLFVGVMALGNLAGNYQKTRDRLVKSEEHVREELQISHFHEDNSPLGVIQWDENFRVVKWSKGAERIFGWTEAEVRGLTFHEWKFIPPEDKQRVETVMARLLAGGEMRSATSNRNYTKDGNTIFCDWYNSVLLDRDGKVRSILSRALDASARIEAEENAKQATYELERRVLERTAQLEMEVSERKRKEDALKSSERRFTGIFNQTLQMMAIIRPDGVTLEVNRAALNIAGLKREEAVNRPFNEAFLWEPDQESVASLKEALEEAARGQLVRYESEVLATNQGLRVLDFSLKPVKDENGTVVFILAEARDITDARLQAEALVESEERFRAALESAPIGMAIVDLEGNWIKVNKAACRMLGYTETELLATSFQAITHEDDLEADLMQVRELLEGRSDSYKMEKRYIAKNGTIIWAMLHACIVRDGHNRPLYFLSEIEDIADRRLSAKKLEDANLKLESTVAGLEKANQQMVLLKEMSDQLQACVDMEEAAQALAFFCPSIFNECSGTIYLNNSATKTIEKLVSWRDGAGTGAFRPEDCWALRRGKIHVSQANGLVCRHLLDESVEEGRWYCVPLTAQGESIGTMQILQRAGEPGAEIAEEAIRQVASTVSEHVSLVFANLKLREILHAQSMRDSLTGLYNRRYMEESFDRELSRAIRNRLPLSVIMLDVDHFKVFNDTFGHDAGDAVLEALGEKLRSGVRAEDISCRYGGEEFMLLLPDAPLTAAFERAEKLRKEISAINIAFRGQRLNQITASIGISAFPDHGNAADALKRAADMALYRSKLDGRDRVTVASLAHPEKLLTV